MRINVIPKNGLANRLRAMASAHILARHLKVKCGLYWKTEKVLPAELADLFDLKSLSKDFDYIDDFSSKFQDLDFQASATVKLQSNKIFINARRFGESKLLGSLIRILENANPETEISFYAGGLFHSCMAFECQDCKIFRTEREILYRRLTSGSHCEREALSFLNTNTNNFVAVHLRRTEMIDEYISDESLCQELLSLPDVVSGITRSVFVSGDNLSSKEEFARKLERTGLIPFWRESINLKRDEVQGSQDALIDLLVLSKSRAMVRSGSTTFSYEAAVLGGIFDQSRHLGAQMLGKGNLKSYLRRKLYVN